MATPELRIAHVTPSVDVIIRPCAPTATNFPLPYATALSLCGIPVSCRVQHLASGELSTTPPSPTATHRPLPHAMPYSQKDRIVSTVISSVGVHCRTQFVPSVEVRIYPNRPPTATKVPFAYATAASGFNGGEGLRQFQRSRESATAVPTIRNAAARQMPVLRAISSRAITE